MGFDTVDCGDDLDEEDKLDGEMSMTDGSIDAQHQTQSPPSFVDANLM